MAPAAFGRTPGGAAALLAIAQIATLELEPMSLRKMMATKTRTMTMSGDEDGDDDDDGDDGDEYDECDGD